MHVPYTPYRPDIEYDASYVDKTQLRPSSPDLLCNHTQNVWSLR